MRVWFPVRSYGFLLGLALALVLWAGAAWLYLLFLGPLLGLSWVPVVTAPSGSTTTGPGSLPISGTTFWLGLAAICLFFAGAAFLYLAIAFFSIRYDFDRNALTLHWGGNRQVVPMNRVIAMRPWAEGEVVHERGLRWPGYHRGHGVSPELGPVEFYATAGREAQVLVITPEGAFVLSPRDPGEFIQEVELRRNLGINRQVNQERFYWWLLGWSIWRDPVSWAIGLSALLVNLSLFALLMYRYPTLPPLIRVHFIQVVEQGQVRNVADVIGRPRDLFKIPAFGLALLMVNYVAGALLHRRHRLLTLLLAIISLVAQGMFWLGAFYILTQAKG